MQVRCGKRLGASSHWVTTELTESVACVPSRPVPSFGECWVSLAVAMLGYGSRVKAEMC
jgi:hypothetical protein